ncbi:SDR family NAD(P)-dependent oxidoreductase [Neobacillus rhizophilus]|uniref:SDR family NAD(P)-dependent oxidoreductase n=1 Tax=Neobacillus rhizophilus TaxID=2833579 RepID=UPI002016D636|nr:SDR family NAD(P)-dependent oxidoreductase [Neobacillus rhizophilus]
MQSDLFNLDGQVALITGGARGLGFIMARALGRSGAKVAICGRNEQVLHQAKLELENDHIECMTLECNVSNQMEVEKCVSKVAAELGNITILVNNAGRIVEDDPFTIEETQWRKTLDTNLTGAMFCAQAAGKMMAENGGGKIINIVSVAGLRGMRRPIKTTAYGVSKAGLILLTQELAVKWADRGICVNAIAPGIFKTRMTERMLENQTNIIEDFIPAKRIGKQKI